MATTTASDFKIYPDQFHLGQTEVIRQSVDKFNAGSAGAITLETRLHKGHYRYESFFTEFINDRHRDITSSAAVDSVKFSDDELVSVKINRGQGPHRYTVDSFKKKAQTPQLASAVLGQQSQKKKMAQYLNEGISAAVAALTNVAGSALVYDGTAAAMSFLSVANGRALYGDAFQDLRALVVHGAKFHDLVKDGLGNYVIDQVAGVTIVSGGVPGALGLVLVVTDSPSLVTSGSPDTYHSLILPAGAIVIDESEPDTMADEVVTGNQNIEREWQLDYTFTLGLRGFKWNVAAGGSNPDETAVALGTNWTKAATDNKSLAGVVINSL